MVCLDAPVTWGMFAGFPEIVSFASTAKQIASLASDEIPKDSAIPTFAGAKYRWSEVSMCLL